MGHKYKAVKDGTLSNPYRQVKAGDIVELDEPIVKSSWLVSPETPEPRPLPIMPMMAVAGEKVEKIMVSPIAPRQDYDNNMATLIARENRDAAKADITAVPVPPIIPAYRAPEPVQPSGEAAKGTGSQEAF